MPNSDFQSQFSMSKMIRISLKKFFIEEYDLWSTFFVIDIFDIFDSTDGKTYKLCNGLVIGFGPKGSLVECATLCVKSWVILKYVLVSKKKEKCS